MRLFGMVLVCMFIGVACLRSPFDPSEVVPPVHSSLGFEVEASREYADVGGTPAQAHADLADQWWRELMNDLEAAGMSQAGSLATPGRVSIRLHIPLDADSLIQGRSGIVGGWYTSSPPTIHVPGDYTDPDGMLGARPASQPIKHEALHHWCHRTMMHGCLAATDLDGNNKIDDHVWPMPDGLNIWLLTWQ